ncbi:hypothetical protein CLV30_12434 [Haloactinopolyspora alba]|uniref:Ribonuclease VapC n=1 Tax=Haloactinopolyspora alba TaxID=648780 RepID=A0A2P8DI93_9ACTN|nr:type II toxin-antitoxin system VapC family toxin [Haloactinopolyspora alba]PSK96950.1 hypothetical protein CLV30_12434 [Haloactinopolyspora alba]
MIVLDTTVLVYAVGTDHPYREPCRRIVEAVRDGKLAATTTVEVVQEFAHVRARRRGRQDAASLASAVADALAPLIHVEERDLRTGLTIYRQTERLGAFDAVLAAAATSIGARALISADKAFGEVDGLRHVLPVPDAVRTLIEG